MNNASSPAIDQRLTMIWKEQADPKMLTLLRSALADGEQRASIRVLEGAQPYKHNHYNPEAFFQHHDDKGTVVNAYGQRVLRVTEDFMVALLGTLEEEVGDSAGELMYRIGYEWGMEDMRSYSRRVQGEFEVELSKMAMGLLLETWWWPLQIQGWGGWHYDFRQAKQGLIFIDLYESAVAKSVGDIGKVVCYFYAGLFAAVFSVLSKRPLSGIEIQCYAMGEDFCRFLISTQKRVNAASFWKAEGATAKEILAKLDDELPSSATRFA